MPGTFSKSNRPKRPGAYVNFDASAQETITPSVGSIVAIPFTHDWGPFKEARLVSSFAEFQEVFGPSTDTPGYIAVRQAFQGEGLPGRLGAGGVLCYRFGGSSAAKASHNLANELATPATALTLTAKYEGTYGDDLRVTIQDYANDSTKDELLILRGTVELERYRYDDEDISTLQDKINSVSEWIEASGAVDGSALVHVSGVSFSGGDDGSTISSGDWTDVWDALAIERFGILSPFDLTGSSDIAAVVAWAEDQNDGGRRFMLVLGGALDEDVADASSDSIDIDNENVIRIGVGSVRDAGLKDTNGNPVVLSTSQLAPRIAGIVAQKGEAKSLTFARLVGLTIVTGPTDTEILEAFDAGVIVLSRDSNADAPVRIERGLTTFQSDSGSLLEPYTIFRNPKFVRTMQGIQNDAQDWAESKVIGQLPVNNKTRDYCISQVSAMLAARESAGVVQSGWSVQVDTDPPPSDDDEFIALLIGLRFGRSAEQVFLTVRVA